MKMIKNKNINFLYFNKTFNKSRLKKLIYWSITLFGEKKTVDLVEILKKIGYSYATKAGLSLSIDDLQIPLIKNKLLFNTESKLNYTNQDVEKSYLTSIEYFSQVIDTWNNTNELLKQEVINNFKNKDVLNPVYMMAFSGARGNISQVRQLVGMRGLMADPSGRIINFPIQSNFREGLTLTEYVISCYGARKGVVDTALRTATSGYLTRRLVDVAQHVIIRLYDCLTLRGIYLYDLKTNNNKKLLSLKNRLIGRVLAEDIYDILIKSNTHCFFKTEQSLKPLRKKKILQFEKSQTKKIALRNQEITTQLIDVLLKSKKPILVRSPLTCQDKNYVCQLCYGWSLSSNRLVSLGESVGIIAAQSIGEPGTQLTMRTFHTGGVFSGQSSNEIRALFDGYIEFPNIINGKFVRTTHGKIAFLTKQKGFCLLKSKTLKIKKILLPLFTLLFVKQGQKVYKNQVLAEPIGFITELEQSVDIFQTIYSEFSGEIRFKNSKSINLLNKTDTNLNKYVNSKTGELWVLASNKQNILKPLNLFIKAGDFIFFNNFICLYNLLYKNNSYSNKIKKSKYNFNSNNFDYKKAKIFNFYNKINNNKILYYSILESNLFINYDYFQVSNIFKKKFIKNNFKKLSTFAFPLDMDIELLINLFSNQKQGYLDQRNTNTHGGHGHGYGHGHGNGHLKAKVKNKKIYSNINEYLFKYSNSNNNFNNNIKKLKKTYFLPFFNKKKNSYGFIYRLCINLNSINKVILFEKYNNNSILPINCFSFCQLDQSKFFKIIIKYNNFYIFKTPFNFILTNLFIIENKTILNIFKNIKINHLNLQYSVLFKLKNLKNKHYFNKGNDYSKNKILKKNKKIFISNLKNFSKHNDIKQIFNKSSNFKIDFFELNYNNKKGKIISFFYNKLGTNISENSLFNNLEDVYSISNSVEIFNNFNKTPSYLIFNNSSLNFFILAIFYKLLYIKLNNTFNKIETRLLNKYSLFNKTKYNSNKIEHSVKPYLNIKPPTWSFYFLNNNIKTSINLLAVDKKLNIKSYNLFLNNFSNNIIFFYKNIKLFQNSNNNILLNINKDFLEQKSILIYNKILLNNNNIYFIKSNLYNSNNFNYLFLSFFEKHKTNFNFFYKVQDNFFNKSFFLFNKTNIIKNKKLFFKKNNFIYFKNKQIFLNSKLEKVNNNDLLLTFDKPLAFASCVFLWSRYPCFCKRFIKSSISICKGKDENFFLDKFFIKSTLFNISYISIIFYFLLNQNFKINNLVKSNNNLKNLLLENNKLNINQKKILYLNKKIIYCYFSNYIYSFLSSNFKIDLYKNKNFKKKEKININNNMKYNLIFSNITFLEFIKNINISINIFYNFLNKFNNNEIYIINKKLKKYFFVSFSINNLIAYNNIFLSLFYNNNLKLDSLLVFKYSNYKQLNMLNNLDILFDKKILSLNLQINKTYFFLSKKNNFNTSIIWFSKSNKLKNKYELINKINFKYYTNNSFKIKTNYNNFKVFTLYNYNNFNNNKSKSYFFTSCFFNKPYILSKHFISDYFIIKSKNINKLKIINKKNINNKFYFFYLLFNNKFKSKINNFYLEKLLNNNTNTSNSFINSLIKYDNINNLDIFFYKNNFIYNLSYLFEIKWANYLNSFYIKKIRKLIQFNSFYNNILTNKQYNKDILIKKYWINDYLKRNILLLANNNYYHDYWLFYKSAFDFLFLPNNYYTGLTKNNNLELYNFNYNFVSSEIELRYCDILNKLFFNKALKIKKIFPINSLYLFRIQIKNNCEQKNLSNTVFDNLSNSNKKMVIKKNYIFNFMKFKFFNLKLKFILTKYNNIYIQNIFLINTNYIFSYLLSLYYIKNDKLSTDFKNLEIKNNSLFTLNKSFDLNSDNYKLINNYNGWVYIINKSDLLFLNYKKIIPSGHFITKHVLFENIVTLNKFFTFRFKNNFLKTEFNNCNSFLKSFVNFKIKKILLNSIFIFNASKFLNFYLYCSNIYLNNLILKNNYLNIDNYFIFTKFYFYKIKIKTILNYKKLNFSNCKILRKGLNNSENNIYLINKFYRIVFFQTSNLKKIKYKSSFLNKHFKNQFINKNFLVNNYNKTDYLNNNFKRIFLIIDSNIYVNKYSRYKPKLLIEKITFKYNSNLVIKFSKFKNICLIEKGFDLNYLNNFSKLFSFYENNLLLPQNDLRYYILKFPFNNVIKRKIFNSPFILIKKQKFLNKFTYCNYLLFNNNKYYLKTLPLDIAQRNTQGGHKHKVCLKKIVSKNDGLKRNYFNFNNKKRYTFYDFFSLKGYYCFKNIYINNIFILLLINIILNFNYKKKFNNNIFVNMNNKKLKIFYIFNSNYKKNFKFYILKNKNNNFCNFSISYCSYIYLYRNNFLNNTYNFSSTIYNINKKMLNNLITLNVYNNKYEKFTNAEKQKNISLSINPLSLSLSNQKQRKQGNLNQNQNFAKIYINFRPFLIENNSFLFQINFIVKKEFTDIYNDLSLIGINKISNSIFNRLKLIKHKIKNVSAYNNKKTLFTNKLPKLKYELSGFKGEVLKSYSSSFFYYSNYFKKFISKQNKKYKNINNIFNLKQNLKQKLSLFPELIYLTNSDFLTYKIPLNLNNYLRINKFKVRLGDFVPCSKEIMLNFAVNQSGQVIFLNKNKLLLRRAKSLLLSPGCICNLKQGDFVNTNSPLLTLTYKNLKTEDIVQGIPKIEQLLEARENVKDQFSLNSLIQLKFKKYKKHYSKKEAVYKSIIFIQQYIVDSVQKVYQSQGVNISDKHIEIIVKQMTSKVRITNPGNTGLLRGDIVYLDWIELINSCLKGKKSQYEPVILGISKACLEMDGFISAASFQETIKILSRAAILQKRDFLRGLKENLILGHLIPVGTGFQFPI
uniref:DNA-directed RNA polymerase subunit beta'' n=1 Tax=Ulva compressa TaxID=63659 RepID=A0A8E6MEA7_ULVCO|nr:DNA-directed RNA polymerase subunit beta [Ulva compressa]